MIFNYDKQNKEIEFNGTLNDILKSTVDFFTKKQDIVKKYNPTEKDKAYFEELKKLLTDDEIDTDSDKAKQLLKTFAEDSGNDALVEYSQNVEIGKQSLADFSESQKQVTQGTTKFRAALSSVGNVIKSVGASMLNMGIAMVASWAIGKVIEGLIDLARYDENIIKAGQEAKESIDNTFKSFEEEKQKVTDLATTFADSTDQIKTAGDAIDQVAEKYTELHNGVIGSTNENRSLSDEDYQSYLNICNQLADQFPQLVSGYDAQGNAMLNLGSNADSAADSIRNLYNAQMLSAHVEMGDNLQDTYKGAVKQVEQYNDQIENLKTENENLQSEMDMYTGIENGKGIFSVGTKRLNIDNRKMTGDQVALINKVLHNLFGDEYSLQGLSDGTTVVDGLEDLSSTQIDGLNKAYAAAVKSFYGDEIKDLQVQINTNKQKSSSIDLLIKDQWNSMTDSLSKYLQTTESFGNLDASIQNAFLGHLTDIDLTSLSKDYDGMVLPFLYSEFIEPMNSLEPEAQESLVNLLTLDTSELNQKEYYDKVHSVIENLFPDDKDIQNQWLKALGLSSTITTASTEMGKIKTAFKNIVSEDLINDLSIDDISIGVQVLKNGFNTDDGWDKFLDAIKNYKSVTTDLGDGPTLAAVLADEDNEVSSSIDSLQSDISSLSDTLSKLKTGEFTDTDLTDLIQQFPQLADQADNLQEAIVSLQADKLKSTINKIDDAMSGASADEKAKAKTLKDSLIKSADLSGITSKEINDLFRSIYNIGGEGVSDMASREGAIAAGKFKETFASVMQTEDGREALYKALLDPDIVKSGFDGIMAAVQSNLSDIFTRRINASNDLLSKISSVQSVLTSQTTGFSIDYDDFSSDSLKDYQSALEYVNGSMQLNTQRVRELTKAKVDEQIATNNSAKAQKQQEYLQNAKQIEALRQKLLDNTDATGKSAESIQSQIDAEQFERAAEKVDKFRDKLDGLKALISDDMKVDKNTGLLTESGALALTLDVDDIQASTENLKTYIKERQQIINDYKADKFGEDEYNQKLKTVDDNIKKTTANINSSRSSMLDLIKTQAQAELDVLNKVIDKRKEALSAKKNYYDYDKTLKNKTKDIQILERQIAALNGSTNAEDKARRAQLQEQLSDAQDALKDTITDHAYSMQSDALDKLSTDLSEDMDEWVNKISSNMEEMTNAINDAVKNAGLTTAGTINAISSILKHYGISDTEIAQSGLTDIKGYASGTDYVPKDGVYNVNENGMESVYSPKYGVLTFLNQGDKVYNADLTKSLLENAGLATKNNMPDFSGMVKTMEECMYNIQNMGGNTYISNFYVDGSLGIESMWRDIDRKIDRKLTEHDKKIVRDFRSLQ